MKRSTRQIIGAFLTAAVVGVGVSSLAAPRAVKPDEFSQLQHDVLTALADNGVAVLAQGSRFDVNHLIDRGCPPNRFAFFVALGDHKGLIGLCTKFHPHSSWHTVLHEIGHVLQWCESGKPSTVADNVPLGFSDETIGLGRIAQAEVSYPELSPLRQREEAEANTFADRVNIKSVPGIINKVCGD